MSSAEDLERQLDAAYSTIRELDDDLAAGRLGPSDHAELKRRSERHAAGLLKRLRQSEQEERRGQSEAAPPPAGARLRSQLAFTLGAVALLLVGLGASIFLGRSMTDERPAAGRTAAGAAAPTGASVALEALNKGVEAEAVPTGKLLAFAHQALDEGKVPAAIWAYQRVLNREPKNAEALTHLGLVLYQGGHMDQGLARVDEALRVDPKYAHAHWDRAHMLFEGKKDYVAAGRALESFLALVPTGDDAERARSMLAEARRQAAQSGRRDGAPPPAAPPVRPEDTPRSSTAPAGAAIAAMGTEALSLALFAGKAVQAYQVGHEIHRRRG